MRVFAVAALLAAVLLATGLALSGPAPAAAPRPAVSPPPLAAPAAPAWWEAAAAWEARQAARAGASPNRQAAPAIPPGDPQTLGAPLDPLTPGEDAALRVELLAGINQERAAAGARPLAPSAELDRVAQERADAIAARGALPTEEEAFKLFARVQSQMVKAGYTAHGWSESITVSDGSPEEVLLYWREGDSYREAMGADYRDLGVGLALLDGTPLYTFLLAWPESEYYGRQTAKISDLAAVRRQILDAVNAARREQRLRPLTLDPRLNAAAQAHAEDMRARGFYSHQTPEGRMPRQRVLDAGYALEAVGENIAEGQFTVAEVMDGWLKSPGHRKNILEPRFTHLGVGLAIGGFQDRYRLLWVQNFGAPSAGLQ